MTGLRARKPATREDRLEVYLTDVLELINEVQRGIVFVNQDLPNPMLRREVRASWVPQLKKWDARLAAVVHRLSSFVSVAPPTADALLAAVAEATQDVARVVSDLERARPVFPRELVADMLDRWHETLTRVVDHLRPERLRATVGED